MSLQLEAEVQRVQEDVHRSIALAVRMTANRRRKPPSTLQALRGVHEKAAVGPLNEDRKYASVRERLGNDIEGHVKDMVTNAAKWAKYDAASFRCKGVLAMQDPSPGHFKTFCEKLQDSRSGTVTVVHIPKKKHKAGDVFFFFSPYVSKCLDSFLNRKRLKKNRQEWDGIIGLILDYNALDCMRVEDDKIYFGPGESQNWRRRFAMTKELSVEAVVITSKGNVKTHCLPKHGLIYSSVKHSYRYSLHHWMEKDGYGIVALVGKHRESLAGSVHATEVKKNPRCKKKSRLD